LSLPEASMDQLSIDATRNLSYSIRLALRCDWGVQYKKISIRQS
jgi:hypothetical protein